MTTKDLLIAARARIADEQRWCKRANALTVSGMSIGWLGFGACRWCAYGALGAEAKGDGRALMDAAYALRWAIGGGIEGFNDSPSTTHHMVLSAFDRAIHAQSDQPEAGA